MWDTVHNILRGRRFIWARTQSSHNLWLMLNLIMRNSKNVYNKKQDMAEYRRPDLHLLLYSGNLNLILLTTLQIMLQVSKDLRRWNASSLLKITANCTASLWLWLYGDMMFHLGEFLYFVYHNFVDHWGCILRKSLHRKSFIFELSCVSTIEEHKS